MSTSVTLSDSKRNLCFKHAVLAVQSGEGGDISMSAEDTSSGGCRDTGYFPSPCHVCCEEYEKESK